VGRRVGWSVAARHDAKWIEDVGTGRLGAQLDNGEAWPDRLARVRATGDPEVTPNAIEA
jgi:hypothetical protein